MEEVDGSLAEVLSVSTKGRVIRVSTLDRETAAAQSPGSRRAIGWVVALAFRAGVLDK